jgi:putative nucleotidyltransferase with HDIG domain
MWKKLFGKREQRKTTEAPSLPYGFKQTLLHSLGATSIPTLPQSAQRVFTVVTNPSSEASDFVDAIEGDEGLAARIIKIANSVYFDRGSGSESVVEAVATIGTEELRNILSSSSLKALFPSSHHLRDQLWEHNIAVAIFSREIAARKAPEKEKIAFLAGLLHDIGKLLLLTMDQEQYGEILSRAGKSGCFCTEEEECYPFNHTEVGHYLAEQWNFSPDLCAAIRLHHLTADDLETTSLPFIVRTADLIAHRLRIGFPTGLEPLQNNSALKALEYLGHFGMEGDTAQEFIKTVEGQFREEKEHLQM